MRGHLTEKADVFSFGVMALELVSGRPNSDASLEGEKIYLLEWVSKAASASYEYFSKKLNEHWSKLVHILCSSLLQILDH